MSFACDTNATKTEDVKAMIYWLLAVWLFCHVHTNMFSYENTSFSLCFGLKSTLRLCFRSRKSGYI